MSLKAIESVVLVGAGKMGLALARGWLRGGVKKDALVLVDPAPGEETRVFAAKHGVPVRTEVPEKPARVLVLAVKPQIAPQVLQDIRERVGAETLVISVMAGIGVRTISDVLGTARVVRTIPNTPAQLGKGATGAFAAAGVEDGDRALADELLGASGLVIWLDEESQIDAVTALSGSGPAYVFLLVEAMARAGEHEGLSRDAAMRLARQTIVGAAALLEADPADAATLRRNVTSPNGTTEAALNVLMAEPGLEELLGRAVAAARARSVELGA